MHKALEAYLALQITTIYCVNVIIYKSISALFCGTKVLCRCVVYLLLVLSKTRYKVSYNILDHINLSLSHRKYPVRTVNIKGSCITKIYLVISSRFEKMNPVIHNGNWIRNFKYFS